MCGIIGIRSDSDALSNAWDLLEIIQNRGQNSCGFGAPLADGRVYLEKKLGLVREAFPSPPQYNAKMALGHVRYPTIGKDREKDAQPFYREYSVPLYLAHNGNIVNYSKLRDEVERKGNKVKSTCDAEVLTEVFAEELYKNDICQAVENVMERVVGSYSVVSICGEYVVFYRDPLGIRPFSFGRKELDGSEEKYFTIGGSESAIHSKLGINFRDVKPGECIIVGKDSIVEQELKKGKHAHCMFEWVYFARPDSVLEGEEVYSRRLRLGENLHFDNEYDIDVVIPVPNTARPIALGFAKKYELPLAEGLLKDNAGRSFISSTQEKREKIVSGLSVIRSQIRGKRVAVIDDSIVRGTTSKRIVKLLTDAGASEVYLFSACPKIKYPCFYGIDFPTKEELIGNGRNDSKIAEIVGAKKVTYQKLHGLIEAIEIDDLCIACLNGEYPVDIPPSMMEDFGKKRKDDRLNN